MYLPSQFTHSTRDRYCWVSLQSTWVEVMTSMAMTLSCLTTLFEANHVLLGGLHCIFLRWSDLISLPKLGWQRKYSILRGFTCVPNVAIFHVYVVTNNFALMNRDWCVIWGLFNTLWFVDFSRQAIQSGEEWNWTNHQTPRRRNETIFCPTSPLCCVGLPSRGASVTHFPVFNKHRKKTLS